MNDQRMVTAIAGMIKEFDRSVQLHGAWEGYGQVAIHKAVTGEFKEYEAAVIAEDVHGDHGQRMELLQLAVVAIKGYIRLGVESC